MLAPRNRYTYLDMLKPPTGFALDNAVGTTFSLDLQTLLAVPLGFANLDWENARGELSLDSVTLLHAIRRCADRITVFCQEGRIAAPTKHHPLFAYLEPMIVEVHAPIKDGVFHAKTWLLRFTGEEGVLYRFICLSKNLTRDSSWDTVLALDGMVTNRKYPFARNNPLGNFIAALPDLARYKLPPMRRKMIETMAEEARRVNFEPPEGFEEVTFWPMGLQGLRKYLFNDQMDRLLVVSPFVSVGFLSKIIKHAPTILVSCSEGLEEVPPDILKGFEAVYVLDDAAVEDSDNELAEDSIDDLADMGQRSLHAKLFIAEKGTNALVWTGSANATDAAFKDNVEFLVQLRGKKKNGNIGIDAFLGNGGGGFLDLLRPFRVVEQKSLDPELKANQKRVEEVRRRIAESGLRLRIQDATERFRYDMVLSLPGKKWIDLGEVRARCWPVALSPSSARDIAALIEGGSVLFSNLTVQALSSFVAFEVAAGDGAKRVVARFALNLPLEGAPDDRLEQVFSSVIGDREQLIRYLLLLLARDEEIAALGPARLSADSSPVGRSGMGAHDLVPLFEALVRALARTPEKLDAISSHVKDLRRTPQGTALLLDGFDEIWKPIWDAHVKEASR